MTDIDAKKTLKARTEEEKEALYTLVTFWVPIKAYEGRKGIVYESRHGERRVFIKHVKRSDHLMRKYKSWAIDEDILADLQLLKVEQIYLYVKGEGLLMTTLEKFETRSLIDEYPPHGMQAFLNEAEWEWVRREKEG